MDSKKLELEINSAVSSIFDKQLQKPLGALNCVKSVFIDNYDVKIDLELIEPINWVTEDINREIEETVHKIFPNSNIEITYIEKAYSGAGKGNLSKIKYFIAVASGKGGVGKSAIAANIAAGLAMKDYKVGILDADIYGPSQPTMFGLEDQPMQVYEDDKGKQVALPNEQFGLKIASIGFIMSREQAAILRGPMLASYFTLLAEQVEWGELDFLIFDLPPGTGDIQLTLTQQIPLDGAVIVTTPQEIAIADVRRSIAMFRKVNVNILGVVENMSYFIPEDMPDKKYYIFGEGGGRKVADSAEAPFLGEIPIDIKLRKGSDSGSPIIMASNKGKSGEALEEIIENLIIELRKNNMNNHFKNYPLIEI